LRIPTDGWLSQHYSWASCHFMGEYSKLDMVKTMGTGGKINAI